ncbi:hypothetical protein GCM10010319_52580 [Streptomyces blastmyceticus]|uniref:Transposase n=1 Tax=Streptomyces blastmyceticus TaxID=68180 RepID=A0ABN0XMM6_9ACTN
MADAAYITLARVERVHGITLLGPIVPDHSHQARERSGLRQVRVHHQLEDGQGHVPEGLGRQGMETTADQRKQLHPGQVRQGGLPGLPGPQSVHRLLRLLRLPRALALLPTRELHEIQRRNRLGQRSEEWQRRYAIRASIEATLETSSPPSTKPWQRTPGATPAHS